MNKVESIVKRKALLELAEVCRDKAIIESNRYCEIKAKESAKSLKNASRYLEMLISDLREANEDEVDLKEPLDDYGRALCYSVMLQEFMEVRDRISSYNRLPATEVILAIDMSGKDVFKKYYNI